MSKICWNSILSKKRVSDYKSKKISYGKDEFESDYDRILFSASFRRLQDKAQVFPLEKQDFVRTRLTHSLEVSSIAKSLGKEIGKFVIEKSRNTSDPVTEDMVDDMRTILSCAGLIHDLGNPPFGHFGETAIREWFQKRLHKNKDNTYTFKYENFNFKLSEQEGMDFLNFEGNAQGLRILTKLHFVIDKYGMNLTMGVLSSVIKYPISSLEMDENKAMSKKIGYFKSEEKIFKNIVNTTGLDKIRNPLVFILEAADDIAYLLGDLEDAFNKGIVTLELFKSKYEEFIDKEEYEEKSLEETLSYYLSKNYEIAKQEYGYEDPGEYTMKSFIIKLNKYLRKAAIEEFINSYDKIMNGEYYGELLGNSKAKKISWFLRSISKEYVYTDDEIVGNEIVGYNIIHSLMNIFVPVVLQEDVEQYKGYYGKLYSYISKNYRFVYEQNLEEGSCSKEYYKLQLVTDFICGMTDSYAANIYQDLRGIEI